jgi:hypothetical protein
MSNEVSKPAAARPPSPQIAEFLKRQTQRARLTFVLDATASRGPTWDLAAKLQSEMFQEAARLGGLEIQLVYYRGPSDVSKSPWMTSGDALARLMARVMVQAGFTQIQRALDHVREEHRRSKIAALVFIGDAMEENHHQLCDAAAGLGVPAFIFQEGDDPEATKTFVEMARVSGGAHCRFEAGAGRQLAEFLRAAAVFATGGKAALTSLNSDAARLLLAQMKK